MADVSTNKAETVPVADTAKRRPSVQRRETPTRQNRRFDLSSAEYYLNRELTWLQFDRRVLSEAQDERTPLLERIKFLSIASSNLDEFFMKRVGGLKQQIGAGVLQLTVDGRTPQQQIVECDVVVRDIEAQRDALLPQLL
ncbi:RNA degradosome polyphosphate kinase, partial [Gammaproteobacteria bacterium]|nr:RNA degradosome polyphosphate kinase [Gammaproteobacteria bacterium]